MKRFLTHLRSNVVAYIALFVALGGTSYAAVSVANHSLVPKNFNPRYIGGYVRAWASVDSKGHVLASGGGVKAGLDPFIEGHYLISWGPRPSTRCAAAATVGVQQSLTLGYLVAQAYTTRGRGQQTLVQTYNSQGQLSPLPFTVMLLCSTPR